METGLLYKTRRQEEFSSCRRQPVEKVQQELGFFVVKM